jgi:hypothetical protein
MAHQRVRSLKIGAHRWDVFWSRRAVRLLLEDPKEDAGGACRVDMQALAVVPLPDAPTMERQVLLHELLHACFSFTDVNVEYDTEELMVATVAGPLLQTLRENPDLVSYLLEES